MQKAITATLIVLAIVVSTRASDSEAEPLTIRNSYHVGIRLGTWINSGDTPPALAIDPDDPNSRLETSINSGSFYFEGYYGLNVLPPLFLEFSLGLVNRGSVNIRYYDRSDYGNLLLYPVLIKAKLYPLSSVNTRFQPFIAAGGGFYYGRQEIQFIQGSNFYLDNGDSETDINYTLGGGVDWLLGRALSMEFNCQYLPINFSDNLILTENYSAVTVTVGIKYRYH